MMQSRGEKLTKARKLLTLAADPAAAPNEADLAATAAKRLVEEVRAEIAETEKSTPRRKRKLAKRGQNDGSIYQLADGRWCAIVPARYSPNGKRHILYGSARKGTNTREAVQSKLYQYLGRGPGPTLRPDQHTVATYLAYWLAKVTADRQRDLRAKTIESYRYTIDKLIVPHIGGMKLQALEPDNVRFMMRRLAEEGRADRTVHYARAVLGIALADALSDVTQLITRNVASRDALGSMKRKKRERKIQPVAAQSIAAALDTIADASDRLLLQTIATFGLRIGEALGLRWKNIDLDAHSIFITEAAQRQPKAGDQKSRIVLAKVKTQNSRRTLLAHDGLINELKAHRAAVLAQRKKAGSLWQDHDLVFPSSLGTPQDARNILRILHAAQLAAGVERTSLHRLRHSAATHLLNHGVPMETISAILGHASTSVTREFYAAFQTEQQKQASAVMASAPFTKKKKV